MDTCESTLNRHVNQMKCLRYVVLAAEVISAEGPAFNITIFPVSGCHPSLGRYLLVPRLLLVQL